MECNHGLVSFDHSLEGTMAIDGREVDFEGGRGYTEKDWGKAFPAGYVWMQTNHFERSGTSFVAFANLAESGSWRRESWTSVSTPPPDGEVKQLLSVNQLTKRR